MLLAPESSSLLPRSNADQNAGEPRTESIRPKRLAGQMKGVRTGMRC